MARSVKTAEGKRVVMPFKKKPRRMCEAFCCVGTGVGAGAGCVAIAKPVQQLRLLAVIGRRRSSPQLVFFAHALALDAAVVAVFVRCAL